MTTLQLHTTYTNGDYHSDLVALLKPEENAVLASPNATPTQIAAQLKPVFDGVRSIAIGYGLDLLTNSVQAINGWLSAANVQLSAADINRISPPAQGQTTLPQNYADTLEPVIAANWQ